MFPTPEKLLERLRAIYCRHRSMSYHVYDRLFADELIPFVELTELCGVLFTEIQHVGLYDFLFREEAEEREAIKQRIKEIENQLGRLGGMTRRSPALALRYKSEIKDLVKEGNALKRRLAE